MKAANACVHPMGRLGLTAMHHASKMKAAWRTPRQDLVNKLRSSADIIVAASLAVMAALLAVVLPDGAPLRAYLALAILLTVPGYLLIQTVVVPIRRLRTRATHLLLGVGASPAVVGLAALSTATIDGGFKPVPIVVMVTIACLSLGLIAFLRRSIHHDAAGNAATPLQAADN